MLWRTLSELRLGYADAANYKDGQDSEHFEASFLADRHLDALKAPQVYFLIGEKGTGKTAYAIYLTYFSKTPYNSDIVFVQPTDYADLLSSSNEDDFYRFGLLRLIGNWHFSSHLLVI